MLGLGELNKGVELAGLGVQIDLDGVDGAELLKVVHELHLELVLREVVGLNVADVDLVPAKGLFSLLVRIPSESR